MRRKLYFIAILMCFSALFTSCNVEIFSHSYTSHVSYQTLAVEPSPAPMGISENDDDDADIDDDNENSFWILKMILSSWQIAWAS